MADGDEPMADVDEPPRPKWTDCFIADWGECWIEKVAATPERDLRGHMIALTYHQYAIALRNYIYEIDWDRCKWSDVARTWAETKQPYSANWFNFATWATATINRDIRTDVMPVRSGRLLPFGLRGSLTPTVLAVKNADRQNISELLTWYQRLVFVSTTMAFLDRFGGLRDTYETCVQSTVRLQDDKYKHLKNHRHLAPIKLAFDEYEAAAVTHQYRNSPLSPLDKNGKEYLTAVRERRVLLANLILTAVEQDVVQPGVERVIEFVPRWASETAAFKAARLASALTGIPRQIAGLRIPAALGGVEQAAKDIWARVLTDQVLVLAMPAEVLRLGRDIPPLSDDAPMFPWELLHLDRAIPGKKPPDWSGDPTPGRGTTDTKANNSLRELVASFDRSYHHGEGSAAADWRRYLDRMNWAVTLLRSRQQEKSLFWPPYVEEDAQLIKHRRRPTRSADPCQYEVMPPLQEYHYDSETGT